ncbi:MAG TPA: hypothetical protein VMD52_01830 [Patescibacteria group bacterium]|nr:hypothetical protein [Patescibacteria group bacterium]
MYDILILPLACALAFVVAHVCLFHFLSPRRRFRALVFLMLGTAAGYVILSWLSSRAGWKAGFDLFLPAVYVDMAAGLIMYFFFCFLLSQLWIIAESSVSVRMMIDIRKGGPKGVTLEELKASYPLGEKLADELKDMIFVSYLRQEGSHIGNTDKGRRHARLMAFSRSFLNLPDNR